MRKDEELALAGKELMLEHPFYGMFLIGLNKEWNESIPTAGVSKHNINYKLVINTEFWGSLSSDHKKGLLWHELLHIVFDHLNLRDEFADKRLFNIAADCELNQYITPSYLPDGAILPSTFPNLQLERKAGTNYYYNMLLDNQDDPDVQNMMGDAGDMHGTWEEFDNLSESEKKLLKSQAEYQLKEAAEECLKSRGQLPGEIAQIYKRITEITPSKFNWRAYLRRFAGNSYIVETKLSRKKLNKRYPDAPGMKFKPKKHILVAIDTSGSVSNDELVEFFNEIRHIHKTGTEITVLQCDTQINSIEKYNPKKDVKVQGRGGTEFDPVLDYYNKHSKVFTCLVYLTDGECYTTVTPRGRMLWVISSKARINEQLPGPQIQLN
jgi:predicted metal-dependent peptidase